MPTQQLKPFLAMVSICLISLSLIHWLTAPSISHNQQQAQQKQLLALMPEAFHTDLQAEHINQLFETGLVQFRHNCTELILIQTQTNGYSSKLNTVTSVLRDSSSEMTTEILRVRVMPPQYETPGLGDIIMLDKSPWISQFDNTAIANMSLTAPHQVDAVSGATISTEAVIKGVSLALQQVPTVTAIADCDGGKSS